MKIMIADDDKSLRMGIAAILTDEGYTCCFAGDGFDVLARISLEKPDLLLLDVMMPGMNGFDVCQTLRNNGEKLPIIILSAKGDFVDKSIGYKFGADDYIIKPFEPMELCFHISAALRKQFTAAAFSPALLSESMPQP